LPENLPGVTLFTIETRRCLDHRIFPDTACQQLVLFGLVSATRPLQAQDFIKPQLTKKNYELDQTIKPI
jgi:hypothetical protein